MTDLSLTKIMFHVHHMMSVGHVVQFEDDNKVHLYICMYYHHRTYMDHPSNNSY